MKSSIWAVVLIVFFGVAATAQTPKKKPAKDPQPVARPPEVDTSKWTPPKASTCELRYRKSESLDDVIAAHASFEYGTQDLRVTWNTWDLSLEGDGTERNPYILRVIITTDDKNEIFDLGTADFDKVGVGHAKGVVGVGPENQAGIPLVVGRVYLVHSVDTLSNFWAKFRVDKATAKSGVTITWQLLTKPQRYRDQSGPMTDAQLREFYAVHGDKRPESRPTKN